MQGKTVVITGATSGIGLVAACGLAAQGARLVLIARDRGRSEETLRRLVSLNPDAAHVVHHADLSRLTELRRTAETIAASEPRIDILINNAGAIFNVRQVTGEAFEKTFATNHLSYFVVTNLLLPVLKATPGARIVSTASDAHRRATLDFADLQMKEGGYSAFGMYGRTKLMNILFTRELARRLAGSGVTANCLHPGFVNTRFADDSGGLLSFVVKIGKRFAISAEEGARTILYLATSAEVAHISGEYFYRSAPAQPTPEARNDADARRLWEVTAKLTGVGSP